MMRSRQQTALATFGELVPGPNTVTLLGDSHIENAFYIFPALGDAVDNGNGTATANWTSPLTTAQIAVGDVIRVNGSATPKLNQLSATVVSIVGTAVTYTITGAYSSLAMTGALYYYSTRSMQMQGMLSNLVALTGGDLELMYSQCQGGARLAHLAEMQAAVPITARSRFCLFSGGENDIYLDGASLATVTAAAQTVIDRALLGCKYFIAMTVPPRLNTSDSWTTAKMQVHLQYDAWLKRYVRSKGGYIVDTSRASSGSLQYADPSSGVANGNPVTAFSADGIHGIGAGNFAVAKSFASIINPLMVAEEPKFPSCYAHVYANDPSIITDNAALDGVAGTKTVGAGTITGTVPDGFTLQISAGTAAITTSQIARSVAADGDAYGNWYRMVVTNSAGDSTVLLFIPLTVARISFASWIRVLCRMRLSSSATPGAGNPVGVVGLSAQARLVYNPGTGAENQWFMTNGNYWAVAQALVEGFSGVMASLWGKTRDASHGPVSSGYGFLIQLNISGVGGCTLDIAHPHLKSRTI